MKKIKVLLIEDNPLDAELLIRYIQKADFDLEYEKTDSLEELEELIKNDNFDLIICDFKLPGFSGLDAISKVHSLGKDIPIILASGTIPDEQAVDAILAGAKDYVLKDNLKRLIPAINREMEALEQRREKRKNDRILGAVFNGPVGVRISDSNRIIVDVNAAYCEMMGYSKEELIGTSIDELIPSERVESDRIDYQKFIKNFLKTGEDTQSTKRDIKKDGTFINVLVRSNVFLDQGVVYVVSNLQDVSEVFKYKTLFEESAKIAKLGGWEKDISTGKEVWTKEIYDIFGVDESTFDHENESDEQFHTEKSWKLLKEKVKKAQETGKPFDIEVEIIDAKGNHKWCRGTGNPILENGKVVKLMGSFQDITEQKNREIEIKQNQEKYKFLFDRSPNPMLIFDVEMDNIIDVNLATEELYGYSREELLKMTATDLRPAQEIPNYYKRIKEFDSNKKETRIFRNIIHQKKNGEIIYVDIFSKTLIIENRRSVIVVLNDVTEKHNYEQELLKTNNLLTALIANAPIGLVSVDEKGRVEGLWNPKAEEIFGWKRDEVEGKRLPYVSEENLDDFNNNLKRGVEEKRPFITEIQRVRKNGESIYLREFVTPIVNERGDVKKIMLLTEDITEKKKVEHALISSEQKYRDLVEASHDLVWRIDKKGNFDFINNASNSILGFAPAEMIGNSFVPFINPKKASETIKIHQEVLEGSVFESFTLEMLTYDGKLKQLSATAYPITDDKGNIIGCSGTASDITHIKVYQSQLEESLAEKEILIKEIHHRVKNNLAVISGLFVLQAMHVDDEETLSILQESQSRIKSIATIHEKLYQNHVFSSIEIKEYLENLSSDIADTHKREDKQISLEVIGESVYLNVNQAVPFGILANELIVNAYKYAFENKNIGQIRLTISVLDERVLFEVCDNGVGLPKDFEIENLTSLGITLVKTLTDQLNASFEWESEPDKGVTFKLSFIREKIAKATWVEKKPDTISRTRPNKGN
jgi:PAS domain S-box-containing protein